MISEKKWESLQCEMRRLEIYEKDLDEQFVLGSGSGGQKIQKTHSAVILKHLPTQITIKTQKSRSREDNRFFARRALCEKIAETCFGETSRASALQEKIKKQKKRRKRRAKDPNDSNTPSSE